MELKILDKKEKILLSRTEIKAEATFTGAIPSKENVRKEIASQLKADEKLVVVKSILPKFKSNKADVLAYHYISKEDMEKVERKDKKKKAKKEEEPEEKPAEKKEAPKEEEKKEESKKEEKIDKKESPKEAPKEEDKK